MTPIEHYWPAELLAALLPERYGHLMPRKAGDGYPATPREPSRQVSEALEGGCRLYRFPSRHRAIGGLS